MNRKFFCLLLCLVFVGPSLFAASGTLALGQGYDFAGNGKRLAPAQNEEWRQAGNEPLLRLPATDSARGGAASNLGVFAGDQGDKTFTCGNLKISAERLQRTARLVADALAHGGRLAVPGLKRYLSRGEDGLGNMHFTGYFSAGLAAGAKPDGRFRWPLYRKPEMDPKPTRRQIDQDGALAGKGLEIAWTDDLFDLYTLHVQGSGQLTFPDGTIKRVKFAGGNGHPYKSIGQHLVKRGSIAPEAISLKAIRQWLEQHPEDMPSLLYINDSYAFFEPTDEQARGTANVDLVAGSSVAADPKYFPMGSCLLAEVPMLDENDQFKGYELRVLFVHDTGGAIKGTGHLDLYHGAGREVGEKAGCLHHYGRVWLLLAD